MAKETYICELKTLPHWICWDREKRPINPRTGQLAKPNDPSTWGTYPQATERVACDKGVSGVGFVFTEEDPYIGIDLDECFDPETGEIQTSAQEIIDAIDSYTEFSPSGRGFHIIARATLPDGKRRRNSIEMYDSGRYFTVTEEAFREVPIRNRQKAVNRIYEKFILERHATKPDAMESGSLLSSTAWYEELTDEEIIRKAAKAKNGAKFKTLWFGDTSSYDGDESRADQALCSLLAFYTHDPAQIDRLFRQSGLIRPKWDERRGEQTYGERTIQFALQHVTETYTPSPPPSGVGVGTQGGVGPRAVADSTRGSGVDEAQRPPRKKGGSGKEKAQETSESKKKRPALTDRVVGLVPPEWLFRTPEHEVFAKVPVGEHSEIHSLGSREFKGYVSYRAYEEFGRTVSGTTINDAINVLYGIGRFKSPVKEVSIRVAGMDGAIYLDLADDDHAVVRVTEAGWDLEQPAQDSPVQFLQRGGMMSLVKPDPGGDLRRLRDFLNVTDESWVLVAAWLIAVVFPTGPYPILVIGGEQGTAKSMMTRVLQAILDASALQLRSLSRDEHELMISAGNCWVLAFDNVSKLSPWYSDALCRLSTGGGLACRRLYSDRDEVIFRLSRPVILTGIEDLAKRPDLQDRALPIVLEPLNKKIPEDAFWEEFKSALPCILGGLLNCVSGSLKGRVHVPKDAMTLPRMADFALRILAVEAAGCAPWEAPMFLDVYTRNREEAMEISLESTPICTALQRLMAGRMEWSGTATELLSELTNNVSERVARMSTWPTNARAIRGILRRYGPALREVAGIRIEQLPREKNRRPLRIIHSEHQVKENQGDDTPF